VKILELSLGSFGTKCHLDVAPMEKHRVYYKGESGFPHGESCESEFVYDFS
jgi:hypothetical protein